MNFAITNKFKITHADIAIFLFFIFASIYSVFSMPAIIGASGQPSEIKVKVNNEEIIFDLNKNLTTDLGKGRHVCVLEIKDGKARITESNCPDKICVKTGYISKAGENIICLPHKVVVEMTGANRRGIDVSIK